MPRITTRSVLLSHEMSPPDHNSRQSGEYSTAFLSVSKYVFVGPWTYHGTLYFNGHYTLDFLLVLGLITESYSTVASDI